MSQSRFSKLDDIKKLKEKIGSTIACGLIGYPLTNSVSREIHTAVMEDLHLNAIYLKIPIQEEELPRFFTIARDVFHGLSVTMPLKEAVVPFIDVLDPEAKAIGAVNTILFREGKSYGYNADGRGAVEALEEHGSLQGKKVLMIGAGGAARAIAYVAKAHGAHVFVLNRNEERAKVIAQDLQLEGGEGLEKIAERYSKGYDVLINCTPNFLPIDPKFLLKTAIVMDIKNKVDPNSLLSHAKEIGCTVVSGREMWINQATIQYSVWFPELLRNLSACSQLKRTFGSHFKS